MLINARRIARSTQKFREPDRPSGFEKSDDIAATEGLIIAPACVYTLPIYIENSLAQ